MKLSITEEILKDSDKYAALYASMMLRDSILYASPSVSFGIIDESRRIINIDREKVLDERNINFFLNQLQPISNVVYKITDLKNYHEFTTDQHKRIIQTYHQIEASTGLLTTNILERDNKILPIIAGGLNERINEISLLENHARSEKYNNLVQKLSDLSKSNTPFKLHTTWLYASNNVQPSSFIYVIQFAFRKEVFEF